MSNEPDTQEQADASKDDSKEVVAPDAAPAPGTDNDAQPDTRPGKGPSRAALWLATLALLGVVALGAGAYYWFNHWRVAESTALDQRLAKLAADVQAAADQSSQVGSQIAALAARGEQAGKALMDLQGAFEASRQERLDLLAAFNKLQEQRSPGRNGWELREVEHLLIVAGQRLTLQQDVATALTALEVADARIGDLADPSWNSLRRQLVTEMNALRSIGTIDVAGIALYFADVMTRVAELPLRDGEPADPQAAATAPGKPQPQDWRTRLGDIWADLRTLVVVKSRDIPDYVAFDPELRYLLQHSLRLELANARLAALSRDDRNFQASISMITKLLNDYFNTQSAPVADLLARLERYSTQVLNPELPDISGSLSLLRERLAAGSNEGPNS